MNRLTPTRTAALVFGLLALAAVLAWIYGDSATTDAWMPAAATGAATIALTVTLVESIIERERRERGADRRNAAYQRLEQGFLNLTFALTFDTRGAPEPGDPIELIEEWLRTADDVQHYSGGADEPALTQGIRYFAEGMSRVLDDDRDVLPDDLRAAMVEVRERVLQMNQTYDADAMRPHTLALHLMLARKLLVAVLEVAKQLRREQGTEWMVVLRRIRRIDVIPGGASVDDPASGV